MVSDEAFDRAIDTWAATGSIPTDLKQDINVVFKLIDSIPQFIQPLTRTQFFNIVEHVVDSVYTRQDFSEILTCRLQSPDLTTRKMAIWLCGLLVPLTPSLAQQLQRAKTIATVYYNSQSTEPRIYECIDLAPQLSGKQAILVYASGWKEYISLLKSPYADISRYTAASLWCETRESPGKVGIQLQMGIPECAYRVFDRSTQFLPFIVSWLGFLNNAADKSLLSWDKLKIILRKSHVGLSSPDRQLASSTFEAICDLVGDNPYTQKKNLCDKMVDLGYHHKLLPYLKDPHCQLKAARLITLVSKTRAEELLYAGALEYLTPLLSSSNAGIRQFAEEAAERVRTEQLTST